MDGQEIVEPVTIEELRKYIGYAPSNSADDDFLMRIISSQRAILEDAMSRVIVLRSFVAHPLHDGSIRLPSDLRAVERVRFKDGVGDWVEVADFEVDLSCNEVVFSISEPCSEIAIEFSAGFGTIPEGIKDAILSMSKLKYDRSGENGLDMVRPLIQKYWREHL